MHKPGSTNAYQYDRETDKAAYRVNTQLKSEKKQLFSNECVSKLNYYAGLLKIIETDA